MNILESLKKVFVKENDSLQEETTTINSVYLEILDIIENFANNEYEQISNEQKNLNGHKHFRLKEVEDSILSLIEFDPSVLTIQNPEEHHSLGKNYNIGMLAAAFGLEAVVIRALDDKVASVQQNSDGYNIGMVAARKKMESAVLKALDNKEASAQVDHCLYNIGMTAAMSGLEQATIKAMENTETRLAVSKYANKNIAMHAADSLLKNAVMKALDIPELYMQKDGSLDHLGFYCLRYPELHDCALKAISIPELAVTGNYLQQNMGMVAADLRQEDIVIKALENEEVALQRNIYHENLGMIAAKRGLRTATLVALKNEQAATQQAERGYNIGMFAVESGMYDVGIVALDNPVASLQQNCYLENMALIGAVRYGAKKAEFLLKALENVELRNQKDRWGSDLLSSIYNDNSNENDEIFRLAVKKNLYDDATIVLTALKEKNLSHKDIDWDYLTEIENKKQKLSESENQLNENCIESEDINSTDESDDFEPIN